VAWPGFIQYGELPRYFGLAGAFVHPAYAEPWGLVVNEALASSLPVIVSRTVGARYELLCEGQNGFSFDPSAPDQLADRLLEISRLDRDRLAAMRTAAFATASKWTLERFGRGLMAMALLPPKVRGYQRGTPTRIASPQVASDRIGRSA
jgi:glycosyltransferase involved in cell wall biosynthesis